MATANGQLSPSVPADHPPSPSQAGTKRKRSESAAPPTSGPTASASAHDAAAIAGALPSTLHHDLLQVLRKYDTTPSVLDHLLPVASQTESPDSRSLKRPKLADAQAARSVSLRLQQASYHSLHELEQDVRASCAALIGPIKTKQRDNGSRMPADDVKALQRLTAFQHLATGILSRQRESVKPSAKPTQAENKDSVKIKSETAPAALPATVQNGSIVLSLFGNAPTQKQLFSSLQQGSQDITGADVSLEQLGLPNMLTATKILPLQSDDTPASKASKPTFADVFPPPSTLPQLNPPKTIRHSSNRTSSISWVTGDAPVKPSRKSGYTLQPLTVGSWLDYGGVDTSKESSSSSRRKRRESVLSAPEPVKPVEDLTPAAILAQEDALFRAAYSSFAPSRDDSKALVPEEMKDRVWWHRVGQKRFEKHFLLDPALGEPTPSHAFDTSALLDDDDHVTLGGADEMKEMEEAIQNFDDDAFKAQDIFSAAREEERSTEKALKTISELIETLSSYQRIRNSYVPSASRNPTSPSPLLTANLGTITQEETEIYKSLRSQLAELISQLPPYAVAKLDGEQLEDLAVSKIIVIEGKDQRGTMEEDQLTRMMRSSVAMQPAAAPASLARTPSGTDTAAYARTPSVSGAARSAHAPPSYSQNARSLPNYNTGVAAAPRYAYTPAAKVYSQPDRRQQSLQAGHYERPAMYGQQYGQATPQPPSQARPGFQAPNQPPPQSRAVNNTTGMTGSPYTAQANYTQPRPTYGQPFTNQQKVNGQPHPQQTNSGQATPISYHQPQTPSALGPSGFHTSMTSEQQQRMMERQRAQLALQPQARMAAQQDASRQGSNTPQPPPAASAASAPPATPGAQTNGDGRVGGTPMVA
ncbi:hypothetical protein MBLNU459_g7124t1 [Dothideomycetes sp. NU459]